MGSRELQFTTTAGLAFLAILALFLAHSHPNYLNNENSLGGLIFLQLLVAALWKFRTAFFPFLIIAFIWAGAQLPLAEAWTSARWTVLCVGALFGYLLFMHQRSGRFHSFHLIAFVCAGAAMVSALVSVYPRTAVLKATSLFLLYLYAGAGGRLAVQGRAPSFFRGVLLGCEITTYTTACAYFLLHQPIWGNPNSLGLVMGIGTGPLLFWGTLIADTRVSRWRRAIAFYLSLMLLFYSVSRASIIGGISAMLIVCVVLRRRKLLLSGAMTAVFAVAVTAIAAPAKLTSLTEDSTSHVFYKGHREAGILGSRKSPWQQTMDVISKRPWFGSGFGTSPSGEEDNVGGMYASNRDTTREHGSSYLALVEWVGLAGGVPFLVLLLLLLRKTGQALAWMWRTGCADHAMVAIVLVVLGGLIHAVFEDWLFAVGYHFTVFFWTCAFVLFDLVPVEARKPELVGADNFEPLVGAFPQLES